MNASKHIRRNVALATGLLVAVGTVLVFCVHHQNGSGPWFFAYYPSSNFLGRQTAGYTEAVNFNWDMGKPVHTYQSEYYSARWLTCLVLKKPATLRTKMASDDGSRLFIDGEMKLDNWGNHGVVSKSASIDLPSGNHLIQVDYYNGGGTGLIDFEASVARAGEINNLEVVASRINELALTERPCSD